MSEWLGLAWLDLTVDGKPFACNCMIDWRFQANCRNEVQRRSNRYQFDGGKVGVTSSAPASKCHGPNGRQPGTAAFPMSSEITGTSVCLLRHPILIRPEPGDR